MSSYVYILASKTAGTLYIGVTSDIVKRASEHREGINCTFSKKHSVHRLVYYEVFECIMNAIAREKQLKKWNRAWKIRLIETMNPSWSDLFEKIAG
jgi:putative endonuclease